MTDMIWMQTGCMNIFVWWSITYWRKKLTTPKTPILLNRRDSARTTGEFTKYSLKASWKEKQRRNNLITNSNRNTITMLKMHADKTMIQYYTLKDQSCNKWKMVTIIWVLKETTYRSIFINDVHRWRVILITLAHFLTILRQNKTIANKILKSRLPKQCRW